MTPDRDVPATPPADTGGTFHVAVTPRNAVCDVIERGHQAGNPGKIIDRSSWLVGNAATDVPNLDAVRAHHGGDREIRRRGATASPTSYGTSDALVGVTSTTDRPQLAVDTSRQVARSDAPGWFSMSGARSTGREQARDPDARAPGHSPGPAAACILAS
jgi:hypothetical protein